MATRRCVAMLRTRGDGRQHGRANCGVAMPPWVPAIIALAAALAGCAVKPVELVESRPAMNTEVTVRAIGPSEKTARRALDAAWKEMDLCVMLLDRYRKPTEAWLRGDAEARRDPGQGPSDVWRINEEAGKGATQVDPIVTSCLSAAKVVYDLSGGAFDPTVGPLVDLWRKAAEKNRLPTDEQLQKARSLAGMNKVEVTILFGVPAPTVAPARPPAGGRKQKPLGQAAHQVSMPAGMRLDLGGVAKGYIAGRMAQRMKRAGATAGLVAAAGDTYAFGERPPALAHDGGDPRWSVGIQDPRFPEDRSRLYTAIHVRDKGVETSGHYYRGYMIEGKRYSHILDPRTGRPVDTHLASVTVVSDDPGLADGLATAIAVLGAKEGLAMVERTEGVECLLLEAVLKEGQRFQPCGAPPPDAELVAYRSKGFKQLEFKPAETKSAE